MSPTTFGLAAHAAERPDRLAVVCEGRRLTYAELDALVNRTAHALRARGLKAGGRVALCMGNVPEFLAVTHAAGKLGAVAVPISWRWRRDEIAHVLSDSEPAVLIVDEALADEALAARASVGGPAAVLVRGSSLDDAVAAAPATTPSAQAPEGGFNVVIYTSGTTGRPKGVMHPTLTDPRAGFESQKRLIATWGWTADDVHLVAGPLYHTMPNAYAGQHLFVGASVVLMPRFDGRECLASIERERITTAAMVPAHFIRILEAVAAGARHDLSSVRKILHAAAPCPPDVKRRMIELLPPGTLWELYGATEGPGTIIGPEEWLQKPGSVGRAWPGVTVTVLDDDGNELPPGKIGTIYLSTWGPEGFRYHNDADKTAAAYRGRRFTVGDMGWLDEDGYLFIADRKHDMVITGGVNVYPAEIEAVLIEHPDVVDVAVFGVPDERWGEALYAVVEARSGSGLDGEAVRAWCRERIADYKVPRQVELVAELPRDAVGKVSKRLLREPHWAGRDRRV